MTLDCGIAGQGTGSIVIFSCFHQGGIITINDQEEYHEEYHMKRKKRRT